MKFTILYCVFVAVIVMAMASNDFTKTESELLNLMFGPASNYSRIVRPSIKVNVEVALNLISIIKIDILTESMSISGWLTMKWKDTRITWKPSVHGGIQYIFDSGNVWRPHISFVNTIARFDELKNSNSPLRVHYTGEILYEPQGVFTTSCAIKPENYPFDHQTCAINLTVWTHTTNEVTLSPIYAGINLEHYQLNGEWKILKTTLLETIFQGVGGNYTVLHFLISADRIVSFYIVNIVLPVMLLSFLSVITFMLPFQSGEKVSYALTVLLAYIVIMLDVLQNMPRASIVNSRIGIYLAQILFVGCSSTAMTIWNLKLYHKASVFPSTGPKRWLIVNVLVLFSGWRKKLNARRASRNTNNGPFEDLDKPAGNESEGQTENTVYTWKEVALMADVACFRIYAVVVTFMALFYIWSCVVHHVHYIEPGHEHDEHDDHDH